MEKGLSLSRRLCFDGASKFPVYVMPNLEKMIADDASGKRQDVEFKRVAYLSLILDCKIKRTATAGDFSAVAVLLCLGDLINK